MRRIRMPAAPGGAHAGLHCSWLCIASRCRSTLDQGASRDWYSWPPRYSHRRPKLLLSVFACCEPGRSNLCALPRVPQTPVPAAGTHTRCVAEGLGAMHNIPMPSPTQVAPVHVPHAPLRSYYGRDEQRCPWVVDLFDRTALDYERTAGLMAM